MTPYRQDRRAVRSFRCARPVLLLALWFGPWMGIAAAEPATYYSYLQYQPRTNAPWSDDCGSEPVSSGTYRAQVVINPRGELSTLPPANLPWIALRFGISMGNNDSVQAVHDLGLDGNNLPNAGPTREGPLWAVSAANRRALPDEAKRWLRPLLPSSEAGDTRFEQRLLGVLCGVEPRATAEAVSLVRINRLLAAGPVDGPAVRDLWRFYAPADPPLDSAEGLARLQARAAGHPGFVEADYVGRFVGQRHSELHQRFRTAIEHVQWQGPTAGTSSTGPFAGNGTSGSGGQRIRETAHPDIVTTSAARLSQFIAEDHTLLNDIYSRTQA